jgi:hemolysin activation/secretion protein
LLYSASVSRGFDLASAQTLMTSAAITGQLVDGQVRRQHLAGRAQYYRQQGRRWLFYASAGGDVLTAPGPLDELLLGGENGLRGYPLRYQSGTQRALFTVEERFYTDLYLWQLFRIGGAAFYDVGRAWGGNNINAATPGWLANVGAGLRIVSARAAFSTVLHVDIAVPLNATADMDKVQLLLTTKSSF